MILPVLAADRKSMSRFWLEFPMSFIAPSIFNAWFSYTTPWLVPIDENGASDFAKQKLPSSSYSMYFHYFLSLQASERDRQALFVKNSSCRMQRNTAGVFPNIYTYHPFQFRIEFSCKGRRPLPTPQA